MAQIKIRNLTFRYDGSFDNIFEDVSFDIDTDWKLGFTGRNGRGKTTFLNLLLGKYSYSGSISSPAEFEYFPYEPRCPSDTALAAATEISGAPDWAVERETRKLGLDEKALSRPFSSLSNGERTKLLLCAMFLRENSFLLIDEPTNHLDAAGREALAAYLASKKGFILVSHDRATLDRATDHTLSINKTNIEIQSGNFSSWFYNKELSDRYETEKNEELKKEIKRLEGAAREKAAWADRTEAAKVGGHTYDRGYVGHKAAKLMKRAGAIADRAEKAASEKSKLLKNIEEAESLKIHPLRWHSAVLARAEGLSAGYAGSEPLFKGLNFTLERGERLAVEGGNGSGKSSLIRLICSDAPEGLEYTGKLSVATGLKISYIAQDMSYLCGSLDDYIAKSGVDGVLMRSILRKLDFSRTQFEKDMSDFSAGQKKKAALARSLCEQAHLYVWDEPLNYVDIFSRMQIEELILKYKPTLVFVEHDSRFRQTISTSAIKL